MKKSSKINRVLGAALIAVQAIEMKCGGPGGTMGPCPGGGASGSAPAPSSKLTPAQLKTIKSAVSAMPSGVKTRKNSDGIVVAANWMKRGGHAGAASLTKANDKLKAQGWTDTPCTSHGNPDGSVVGSGKKLYHPDGHVASSHWTYGSVAADNSFSMEIKFAVPSSEW